MSQNKYLNSALSDFMFDMANGGAIRHLTNHGYTVKQIMEKLDFSAPCEKVRQTVWDTLINDRTILLEEPGIENKKEKTSYIEERGAFGKTSFRRIVTIEETYPGIEWNETLYRRSEQTEFFKSISAQCTKSGRDNAYVSCDFGVIQRNSQEQYELILNSLKPRQREYIEGLPWPSQRVYHCLDIRMTEIISNIMEFSEYNMSCYFIEQREKITIL